MTDDDFYSDLPYIAFLEMTCEISYLSFRLRELEQERDQLLQNECEDSMQQQDSLELAEMCN